MRVIALLNRDSGTAASSATPPERQVAEALAAVGVDADVRCVAGEELNDEAKAASAAKVDAVIAGGGDGTISTVAAALVGSDTLLGVLPLGTLNHFAKDLGIPLDLAAAAQIIAANTPRPIDLARHCQTLPHRREVHEPDADDLGGLARGQPTDCCRVVEDAGRLTLMPRRRGQPLQSLRRDQAVGHDFANSVAGQMPVGRRVHEGGSVREGPVLHKKTRLPSDA